LDPGFGLRVAAVDPQGRTVEVDMAPPQRRHFATTRSGDHRKPEQQTPLRVRPCVVHQRRRLFGARWVRFSPVRRWCYGHRGLVHAEMLPTHRPFECATDDVVDLTGGTGAKRSADMPGAGSRAAQLTAAVEPSVE